MNTQSNQTARHQVLLLLPAMVVFFSLTGDCADESDDVLIPAAFSNGEPGIYSVTTAAPVSLFRGAVLERATDLTLPTSISNWQHERTYTSRLNNRSNLHGRQWLGGFQSRIIYRVDGGVRYRVNASASWFFRENQGNFSPGSDFDATLVRQRADTGTEFILTRNGSGDVEIFYGLDSGVSAPLRGKLKERTTRHYQSLQLTGETYAYDDRGRLTGVTTASPQQYRIRYTYETTGNGLNLLQKIEVSDSAGGPIAEVSYVYFDTAVDPHVDLGSSGDLVQVKVSERTSARGEWDTRVTQYRYHRTETTPPSPRTDGLDHQIKMVLEPDAVERILAANPEIEKPEDILSRSDTELLAERLSISEYASRSFTYFKEELDINEEIETPWGKERLVAQYAIREIKRLIPAGHVKTESIRSSCFSCGGGSVSGGVTKTYHYILLDRESTEEESDSPDATPVRQNIVSHIVVEDTQDSDSNVQYRTIYSLNSRGQELRKIDIENPTLPKLTTYATSSTRNQAGQPIESRSPEVHTVIDTDVLVAKFLNPYDAVSKSWANDTVTMEPSKGQISVYEYDNGTPPKRTASLLKIGSAGEAWYVSATDYNESGHVTAEYTYPTRATNRDAGDRVATRYEYTYRDQAKKIIQTRKEQRPAIPESQNGSGLPSTTQDYYDLHGHLRWSVDPLGVVTYYGYHPVHSLQTLTVRDVDTSNLPVIITQRAHNIAPWLGPVPVQRADDLPIAWNDISVSEIDGWGNRTADRRSGGLSDLILREPRRTIRLPQWDPAAGQPLSAIIVEETDAVGQTQASYRLPTSAVVLANGRPVGVDPNAKKLSWTRYGYDPLHGTLRHVDRYHRIPEEGLGSLGEHFYRTVTIYDRLGRDIASAQYIENGEWSIDARILDWRGRVVEQRNGVAISPPRVENLHQPGFLDTVSKNTYKSNRIDRQITITGPDNCRGIIYRYDAFGHLRGTSSFYMEDGKEHFYGPYSVTDFDWNGRSVASAVFEKEPNWDVVFNNGNYAAETTVSRQSFFKNHYDIRGNVYRTETCLLNPDGSVASSLSSDAFLDVGGREVARAQTDAPSMESAYDALGRLYQQRTVNEPSPQKFDGGRFRYRNPQPQAALTGMKGGSDGVLQLSHFGYDSQGRMIASHTVEADNEIGIDFDKNNYVRQTNYSWYDKSGRLIVQAAYGSGDMEEGAGTWRYASIPTRPDTPPTETTETCLVSQILYDPETGEQNVTVTPSGLVSKTVSDPLGRQIRTILHPVDAIEQSVVSETTYNAQGQTVAATDPLGNITRNEYDHQGRLLATIDAEGGKTVYTYDFEGKTISVTDPTGRTTHFEYDKQGRQIRVVSPVPQPDAERSVRTTVYDTLGRVVAQIDPLGNTKRFVFDVQGRPVKEIDAMGGETIFTYDRVGRMTSLTDPVGNTTAFEYDLLGRKIAETNALGKTRRFEYIGSLLARKIDRNGRVTEYDYDRFGRMKEERWLDGERTANVIRFEYDPVGGLQSAADNDYRIDYERDVFGREIESMAKFDPAMAPIIQKTTYDKIGQRLSFEMGKDVTNYTYTPTSRMATINWNGLPVEYSYDAAGRKTSVKTPALTSTFNYDGMGRLASIEHGDIVRYDYAWDAADRIVSKNDAQYGYDKTSQLISADYEKLPAERYAYDLNGNRLNFRTGPNNQLLHDGRFAYAYDDEGNRIAKGDIRYFWDHRNRLVKVVDGGKVIEYKYDYLNRLYQRNDEFFVHDGWQIVCSLKNGDVVDRYLWGARQDELLCENANFVLTDHLGTVRKIVDKNGQAVSELEYDAFGRQLDVTDIKPRFRYTGKMFDDDTGLQWNINRWYDAQAGRWTSEDPVGFEAKDANLYRYVSNAQIMKTDPFGLYEDCVIKVHVGHGAAPAVAFAHNVSAEGAGPTGFGKVAAIACNTGGAGNDINSHLAATYKVVSGLPRLPKKVPVYPLDGLLWQTVLASHRSGEEYAQTRPSPIASMTQPIIASLWPANADFNSPDPSTQKRAYNDAASTVYKAFVQALYKEGLSMAADSRCCNESKIILVFNAGYTITLANFTKGVWNRSQNTWTHGVSGANYTHEFKSNTITITITRSGAATSTPVVVVPNTVW